MSSNIQKANIKTHDQNFKIKSSTVSNKIMDADLRLSQPSDFDYENIDYDKIEQDFFEFDDFTDYQYNKFSSMSYLFATNPEKFEAGKRLCELEFMTNTAKEGETPNWVNQFQSEGYGDLEIVESYVGEDGYSCLVLKDEADNYMMINPPTKEPVFKDGSIENYEDLLYDFYPLFKEIGLYDTALTDVELENLIPIVLNACGLKGLDIGDNPLEYIENIYKSQRKQAEDFTKKYYDKALAEGKKISFFGYSKGGGMAEYSCLSCADYEASGIVIDEVVLYNPFHDDLNKDEVKTIKNKADITLYRNQGDVVSTIFNEHDFEEDTKYIKCDWKNLYSEEEKARGDAVGQIYDLINYKIPIDISIGNLQIFDEEIPIVKKILPEIKVLKKIENIESAIHGKPHQPGEANISEAYDSEGNAIPAESYEYSEVSKKIFGVKDIIGGSEDLVEKLTPLIDIAADIADIVDDEWE